MIIIYHSIHLKKKIFQLLFGSSEIAQGDLQRLNDRSILRYEAKITLFLHIVCGIGERKDLICTF